MSYERHTCSKSLPVCCRCLVWFLGKIRKKSPKIDLNRIIRRCFFRFLKFEFFGSIELRLSNTTRKNHFEIWTCSMLNTSLFSESFSNSIPPRTFRTCKDFRDVTSHKELWEGTGNSHSHESYTVLGMGREPGIFQWKKICRRLPEKKMKIASESENVFARIFCQFFRC